MSGKRKPDLAETLVWLAREEARWQELFEVCRESSKKRAERLKKPQEEED